MESEHQRRTRLFFLDNLRSAIIILVVLHHAAVVYGADTPFYYVEPHGRLTTVVLALFQLLNQAWFMGAFFLLSGYFSPGSYEQKGVRTFLKDRLVRLGIPILAYSFVLGPLASLGRYWMPESLTHITAPLTWSRYPHLVGFGPLWFALMLLIFDFGYVLFRLLARNRERRRSPEPGVPGYGRIGAFVLLLALGTYLIRIVMPLGRYFLGFPSLYDFAQYLGAFCVGVAASRGNWLQSLPGTLGKRGLLAAGAATLILFPVALVGVRAGQIGFAGHGHWQSAVYALWESIYSVGLFLGLVCLFRRVFDRPGGLSLLLSRHSFAVYIVHIPVLVFLAIAIRDINLAGLLKFALLSIMAVPASFSLAYLLRKIPLVSRVI